MTDLWIFHVRGITLLDLAYWLNPHDWYDEHTLVVVCVSSSYIVYNCSQSELILSLTYFGLEFL